MNENNICPRAGANRLVSFTPFAGGAGRGGKTRAKIAHNWKENRMTNKPSKMIGQTVSSITLCIALLLSLCASAFAGQPAQPKATGDIYMSGPSQQIDFCAFGTGDPATSKGQVEYWNYDYPGVLHYTAPVLCANV